MKAPKTSPTTITPRTSKAEREELLDRLYNANLRALVEQLEAAPKDAPAALLNVSRQLLSDNFISHDTLSEQERTQEAAKVIAENIRDIPEFDQNYQ